MKYLVYFLFAGMFFMGCQNNPEPGSEFKFPFFKDSLPIAEAYASPGQNNVAFNIINAIGKKGDSLVCGKIDRGNFYENRDSKKERKYSGLQIFVDTLVEVSADKMPYISFPSFESDEPVGSNKRIADSLEQLARQHDFRYKGSFYKAMPVFILNSTTTTVSLVGYDLHLFMIQEAIDSTGKWKPIEVMQERGCGNGYGQVDLHPDDVAMTKILKYKGNYKTLLRVKLLNDTCVVYSQPFTGSVNYSQFSRRHEN